MAEPLSVAVIGLIHDHVWNVLRWWNEVDAAELVAAADANPPLLERVESEFGVTRLFPAPEPLLKQVRPDVVLVYLDNAGTADVVEQAAAAGAHVMVEKPMAATLEQADRMLAACRRARVELMVNWPTAWNPGIQTADRLIREGAIGRPHKLRYLAAHQGPKEIGCSTYFYEWLYDPARNGAGALMDYCCYGANMAAHWLGRPDSVVGVTGTLVKQDFPVEDNAILLMQYPGAFAVAEASWTQQAPDGGGNPSVYGDAGTLAVFGNRVRLARAGREPEWVEADAPSPGRRNGAEYFLSCLRAGVPVEGMCSAAVSRTAQEILEFGLRSARCGQRRWIAD